ncbi:response regulator transcription factor [Paenibacillus sediminis]|uniref:Two-component system response regulator DesR n=1 Tax=Paenibacillus sediminis TaxID=664909 RepID=A0ABS4H550_9BACL|nr:response regulator transcription factor [Paenibacillus sediminis]MBP1937210.1 two-component system response regulator DesR [Paenibacillus sediminis]
MIRVIIAEDQSMVRGALTALLNMEEDIEVIDEAADGETVLHKIELLQPDICILDIEMPGMSGLDVAEAIKNRKLPSKVVIVTTFGRAGYLQRALKAGVKGYMLKDAPVEQLAQVLRDVSRGGRYISPELAVTVFEDENPLTERERMVLQLASDGLSTAEMAKHLFLSEGTIRNYMSELMQKLEAKNRIDAVKIAQSKGWI